MNGPHVMPATVGLFDLISPSPPLSVGAKWAYSFDVDSIVRAAEEA